MLERELQDMVVEYCKLRGYLVYHTYDSRRSEPGFPDLVIVGQKVLYRELKSEKGRLSAHQTNWLLTLRDAGHDVGVWRPADWPINIMLEIDLAKPPHRRHALSGAN